MSIHPVSAPPMHVAAPRAAHTPDTQAAAQSASVKKESVPGPTPSPSTSVSISGAAKAALQEATETATQTANEARHGDLQAQRLLARTEK